MGDFSKKVLTTYVESECKRQLFLLLAEKDSRWMNPLEDIEPLTRERIGLIEAQKLGNKYQQQVYAELIRLNNAQYAISPYNNVIHSTLKPEDFDNYFAILMDSQESFCLLEKRIGTPKSFLDFIFKHNPIFDNEENFVLKPSETLIPDIIVLGNTILPQDGPIYEFLPSGVIQEVSRDILRSKFALNILDIKMTNIEKVSKRQFIEILFYLFAFSHFITEHKLTNRFFINVQASGILPLLSSLDLRVRGIGELLSKVVLCNWVETKRIFDSILDDIKNLVIQLPCSKNNIELKIQPSCGRCDYLEDCKVSLHGRDDNPGNWDVRLIPYTTNSLSEQMNVREYRNINDVLTKPLIINDPPLPESIYSEMPLIKLKAEALVNKSEVVPTQEQITTVSIPSQFFAPTSISFTIEADPIHNRVFGAGIYVNISVFKTKYADKFESFWSLVATHFRDTTSKDINLILTEFTNQFPYHDPKILKNVVNILKDLFSENAELFLKSELNKFNKESKFTNFQYWFAYVNDDLTDESEYALVKALLLKLWDIIILSSILEEFISEQEVRTYTNKKGEEKQLTVVYSPNTAIYYWSYELLDYLEQLAERHLVRLLSDPSLRTVIQKILGWINPSESKVKDYKTYKKIYDLRIFAETVIGLPFIINYTWHDVYNYLLNRKNQETFPIFYWTPHFNYMDFNVWYWYLNAEDTNDAIDRYQKIKKQLIYKVRALDRIRNHFQISGKGLINLDAIPISSKEIGNFPVNNSHHAISHAFITYNLLTSTVSEMEVYEYRTMYPEYSIGRLNGAEITFDLDTFVNDAVSKTGKPRFYFKFRLYGLSSHMSIEVGSRVFMLPNNLRNKSTSFLKHRFTVEIAKLNWVDTDKCYEVETKLANENIYDTAFNTLLEDAVKNQNSDFNMEDIKWYIYPTTIEAWEDKLEELLRSFHLGTSWLGFRLCYLWKLSNLPPKVLDEKKNSFTLQEIYYYYPQTLPVYQTDLNRHLETQMQPSPNNDSSQVHAINFCLSRVMSGIQGPPGTGKSQTIVSLVDEFLVRNKNNNEDVRIIITAFSYQALHVLIEKFAGSTYGEDTPSEASKLNRVFLRSSYREPVSDSLANDLVYVSSWKYNGKSNLTNRGKYTLENHIGKRYIIFSVAHQLFRLYNDEKLLPGGINLDLLIVDEASQLPVDQFMASLRFVNKGQFKLNSLPTNVEDVNELVKLQGQFSSTKNLTKVVFVGDHNQLPPVRPVKPPKKLEGILGSVFAYYFTEAYHNLESKQLEVNYRSHKDIVAYTGSLGFYQNLRANASNANQVIAGSIPIDTKPIIKSVFEPENVINAIIHTQSFETSVSLLEATLAMDIIMTYYKFVKPTTKEREIDFWTKDVGVVAPHNAQSRLLIRMIHNDLNKQHLTQLDSSELMLALKGTIFSVEKFQGSARTLIIATIGVSSTDQLMAEEEFLYALTRFNVLTSRAKSKFILICSKNFLDYYPNDNEVLDNSTKIRNLAVEFCNTEESFEYLLDNSPHTIKHRWFREIN